MTFIEELVPHAQRLAKEYNILASLLIAQACHESRFGDSGLAQKGKNLFGVKGSYQGQSIVMKTWEHLNGKDVKIDASFRKYPTWYESMKDVCELYKNGVSWDRNKYRGVIGERVFANAAKAIERGGYATDPYGYANKLISICNMYNLTKYDGEQPIMWDDMELKKGQIGRLIILKRINLWTDDENGKLKEVKVLEPGGCFRVYGYRSDYGGQYDVGAGHWVTKMSGYVRYETPGKALLDLVNARKS